MFNQTISYERINYHFDLLKRGEQHEIKSRQGVELQEY